VTRPHGTNTRGLERRGSPQGPKLSAFGKAAQTDAQRAARGLWWHAKKLQDNQADFYAAAREYQADMNPSMLPLKTGGDFQ
jgi:hypothetical protein